ncbi:hypothetical protein ACOMHN_058984 [Nucella lapillus]
MIAGKAALINKACEGWHRRSQSSTGAHHSSVCKFLQVVKRPEAAGRDDILQLVAEIPLQANHHHYEDSDQMV